MPFPLHFRCRLIAHELSRAALAARLDGAEAAIFRAANGRSSVVSRNTRRPGRPWRVTQFCADGTPWGHAEFDSFLSAAMSAGGFRTREGPPYGGQDFRLTWTL